MCPVGELGQFQHAGNPLPPFSAPNPVELGVEDQIALGAELLVQGRLLRHHAKTLADFSRLSPRVAAEHGHPPHGRHR